MSKKKRHPEKGAQEKAQAATNPAGPRSAVEKLVWEALERARQRVKPAVKKEMEAEVISRNLLNFRLRGRIDDPSSSRS